MEPNDSDRRNRVTFGPFTLIMSERRLERNGVSVKLGSRALDILSVLTKKAGQIVQKREILEHVWPGMIVEENTLRVHIKDLRKALEDDDHNRYIVNVPGRGYGLVIPEEREHIATPLLHPSQPTQVQHLPPRPRRVVGRDGIINALTILLLDKRFVTLHGPGGIGKTTIATAVAHDLADRYEDGVIFVDLGTLTDGGFVPDVLCSTLGLLSPSEDPSITLIHFLKGRRMLIVLDCCEHVIDTVARIAERIHQSAHDVSLLTTSREPLRVIGEHVYQVGPLELPPDDGNLSTAEILASPAVSFFMQHAQACGPSWEFDASNAKLAFQICRRLDGIALALELAAMWAGMHGLYETANLLNTHLQLEWKGRRTAIRRHQTLNAMLDWSHELLCDAERRVLRRLSIFVGTFALQDALTVVSDDESTDAEVIEILDQLVAKSLVSSFAHEQVIRYRLLDTTRAYVHAKLVEAGEEYSTSQRHAVHCKEFLLRTSPEPSGIVLPEHLKARAWCLGNVREALKWCFSPNGDKQLGVELAAVASALFIELSLVGECRRWTEQALNCMSPYVRGGNLELQLQAALGHSLMFTIGNDDKVQIALERGLQIAADVLNPLAEFKLLSCLHMYYRRTGEFGRLLPLAKRTWEIASLLQEPVASAAAHIVYGVSHHLLGDQEKARIHVENPIHHLSIVRQVRPGHYAFHRRPEILIGRVLWLQGHPEQAVQVANRLTAQLLPGMDAVTAGIALIWATSVHVWVGDWKAVKENAQRLVDLTERHGLKPYLSVGLALEGQIALAVGDYDCGIDMLRDALSSLHLYRYELYTAELSCALAIALASKGLPDQALPIVDDALARVRQHGGAFTTPELLRVRGEVLKRAADERGAEIMFQEAIALADEQSSLSWRLRSASSLARLCFQHDQRRQAIQPLLDTYARFNEGFDTADLIAAQKIIDEAI